MSKLEKEVQRIRHDSLIAARQGNYQKVAKLTLEIIRLSQAAGLNRRGSEDLLQLVSMNPAQPCRLEH
jgi:hypothetical protein